MHKISPAFNSAKITENFCNLKNIKLLFKFSTFKHLVFLNILGENRMQQSKYKTVQIVRINFFKKSLYKRLFLWYNI